MRLVITGASGFVGRALVPAAARARHTGLATGREAPRPVPPGWEARRRTDVLDSPPGGAPPDAVVHLEVRQPPPRPGADDIADLERVNVAGTEAWLDWAGRMGIDRFVFVSSVMAVARSPGPITEDAPPQTTEPYGASKARAESAVRAWAAGPGRSAVILRPAPVYGPEQRGNLVNFVTRVARGRTSLVGDGGARKSIVSRDNLVAAILHAAGLAGPGCAVFNVSDREGHTIAELAAIVAELTGAAGPRAVPAWLARLAAPLADAVAALTGRDLPLSSARLRSATAPGYFPCQRLVESGFTHPQSTRDGLAVMLEGLELLPPRHRGDRPCAPSPGSHP